MNHSIDERQGRRRRRFLRSGVAAVAGLATLAFGRRADAALADPLRLLCSGPAGSIPDLIARAVGEQLSATLGRHAVVDNRPGAAGQIGLNALKAKLFREARVAWQHVA